jgi:glycerol-3-phosphate acyltransferase PlsY
VTGPLYAIGRFCSRHHWPVIGAWIAIAIALLAISGLLIWRHSANIKRLFAGTESRVGSKAAPVSGAASAKGRRAARR